MSTLQFVILLLVILLSTNGPTHITTYVRKIRHWLFKRRVAKISATLARHGILFRNNSMSGFTGLCLSEDFDAQPVVVRLRDVTPTFAFPTYDRELREAYENKGQTILGDFLHELCGKQYPRKWFSKDLLRALKTLTKSEKTLMVPQPQSHQTPEKILMAMKIRLDKYILDNR